MVSMNEIYPGLSQQEAMLAQTMMQQPGASQPAYYQQLGYPDAGSYNRVLGNGYGQDMFAGQTLAGYQNQGGHGGGGGGGTGIGIVDAAGNFVGEFAAAGVPIGVALGIIDGYGGKHPNSWAGKAKVHLDKANNSLAGMLNSKTVVTNPGFDKDAVKDYAKELNGKSNTLQIAHERMERTIAQAHGVDINKYEKTLFDKEKALFKDDKVLAEEHRKLDKKIQKMVNDAPKTSDFSGEYDELMKEFDELSGKDKLKAEQKLLNKITLKDEVQGIMKDLDAEKAARIEHIKGTEGYGKLESKIKDLNDKIEIEQTKNRPNKKIINGFQDEIKIHEESCKKYIDGYTAKKYPRDYEIKAFEERIKQHEKVLYETNERIKRIKRTTEYHQQAGKVTTAENNVKRLVQNKAQDLKKLECKINNLRAQALAHPGFDDADELHKLINKREEMINARKETLRSSKSTAHIADAYEDARLQRDVQRRSGFNAGKVSKDGKKYYHESIEKTYNASRPREVQIMKDRAKQIRQLHKDLDAAHSAGKANKARRLEKEIQKLTDKNNKFFEKVAGKPTQVKGGGILGWCNKLLKSKNIFSKILGFAGKALALDNPVGIALTLGIMAYEFFSSRSQNAHGGNGGGGHYA